MTKRFKPESIPQLTVYSANDFRAWLQKNGDIESRIALVIYKKHTGENSPSHRELLDEAICYGWIDTTIKRIDDDRYIRNFARRTNKSSWSDNTLSYARLLEEKGKLQPYGKEMYELGKLKPTHDDGIPKNPDMPDELKRALQQDPQAQSAVESCPPSTKRMFYRWILSGKRPETRKKRVRKVIENALEGKKHIL